MCRSCGGGLTYCKAVAEAVGTGVVALLANPRKALGQPAIVHARKNPREPLPSDRQLEQWHEAGRQSGPTAYLNARGLSNRTIRKYELGWDGEAHTFPVFSDAPNLVRHRPGGTPKYKALSGHEAVLYPNLPTTTSVVLVAGMFDALIGLQHGVPAVTTTCGSAFPMRLAERFRGKSVAVCFDAGEGTEAILAAHKVRESGGEAWVVELDLPAGQDLSDWFVRHRRTRERLYTLIRSARS
jgi:hypothetical protein